MTDNQQLRILLIEDSRTQVELVRMVLSDALNRPFSLEYEDRLAGGLERLSQSQFDVLLLDLNVLDSAGFDTFLTAKAATNVPIIILSGAEDADMADRAVKEGAHSYLVKGDYSPEELASCIHRISDHPA
jgi:DNA-binding NtrC family response regulator